MFNLQNTPRVRHIFTCKVKVMRQASRGACPKVRQEPLDLAQTIMSVDSHYRPKAKE